MTLGRLLLEQRRRMVGFVAATVVLSVVAPLKSFIMQWLIDAGSREQALGAMGLGILVVLVSHLAELLCRNSFSNMATQAVCRTRCRIMERLSRRSMKAYLQSTTGDLQSCLTNEMKQLYDDYYMGIFNICIWGGMAVSALVMMALISPVLLVLAVVLCLVPLMIPRIMAGALGRERKAYMQDTAVYTGRAGELLRGFEALLSAGGMNYMVRSHEEAAECNRRCDLRLRRVMNRGMVITSLGAWVPGLLVLLVGVLLVFDGRLTIGYLVTANSLTNFVIGPFRQVSGAFVGLRAVVPIKRRVEALMNEVSENTGTRTLDGLQEVRMEQVTYTYPDAMSPALRSLSLTLRRGEKVALVGRSGSGKSTVARLLYRYDDSFSGEIVADGIPLRELQRENWYGLIGMIPQTPFLFADTLQNNICLYHPYSAEEVQRAVRLAGLEEFISSLPEGLNTPVQDGGRGLSGGQLQRIAIARALVRQCELLLVDEATSSLDVATTCQVMDCLAALPCTVLLITHDLYGEALQHFDRICLLEEGRLEESGTWQELLARHGRFSALYHQMRAGDEKITSGS